MRVIIKWVEELEELIFNKPKYVKKLKNLFYKDGSKVDLPELFR